MTHELEDIETAARELLADGVSPEATKALLELLAIAERWRTCLRVVDNAN